MLVMDSVESSSLAILNITDGWILIDAPI